MTGDCCRPEGSIHRCVRTHSHLYSYIYGLVALLDNIQLSFSKYHYLNINHAGFPKLPIASFFFSLYTSASVSGR